MGHGDSEFCLVTEVFFRANWWVNSELTDHGQSSTASHDSRASLSRPKGLKLREAGIGLKSFPAWLATGGGHGARKRATYRVYRGL